MGVKGVVLAILIMMAPAAVFAQSYGIEGAERYARVEASTIQGRRGPLVSGYVYNLYGHQLDRVRVVIEAVDGSGKVTSSSIAYVLGAIPVGGYGSFEAPAPAGTYRVRVLSFEPVGRGGS